MEHTTLLLTLFLLGCSWMNEFASGRSNQRQDILIRGGKIVNDDRMFNADVFIRDGKIGMVGSGFRSPQGTRIIDATGKYVIPGGIDPHTHFEMYFFGHTMVDDFYTGTRAALAGGTTMIIDFAMGDAELIDNYNRYRALADGAVGCDYSLHIGIYYMYPGITEHMYTLAKERGINSFKIFLGYPGVAMLNNTEMYKVMKIASNLGALVQVHAEYGELVQEVTKSHEANNMLADVFWICHFYGSAEGPTAENKK